MQVVADYSVGAVAALEKLGVVAYARRLLHTPIPGTRKWMQPILNTGQLDDLERTTRSYFDTLKSKLVTGIQSKTTNRLPSNKITTPIKNFANNQIENVIRHPELTVLNPIPPIPLSLKGTRTTEDLVTVPYIHLKNKLINARRAKIGG